MTSGGAADETAVVAGAGIVGVATALHLLADGRRVLLIDPDPPGKAASDAAGRTAATYGNAGMIAGHIARPLAMPGIWRRVPSMLLDPTGPLRIRWAYLPRLMPWLARFLWASRRGTVERLARDLATILEPSWDAYQPLLAAAGEAGQLRRLGNLMVFRDETGRRGVEAEIDLMRRVGVAATDVGENRLRDLAPSLSRNYRYGVHFEESGHAVDPRALVAALTRHFEAAGGTVETARVTGFRTDGRRVTSVVTDRGERPAGLVVLAAGIWSGALARDLGVSVPLETERGYHVTLADPGVEVPMPTVLGDAKFAASGMSCGLRLAGTIELAGLDAPPDPRRHEVLLRHGLAAFPGLDVSRPSRWMGFRPSMPDSLPVIGRAPRLDNVLLGFGHGHLGLTLGAITGRMLADIAAGRTPPVDPHPFRPDRF